jgi:oligopeptide/dipeptide ABC transporter ATP-binding protein
MGVDSPSLPDFHTRFATDKQDPVLRVRDLTVRFPTAGVSALAVDRVSFDLQRGESLALIGESGSGKTTLALSLLRLLSPGAQVSGRIEIENDNLLGSRRHSGAGMRARGIAMVFQDPLAALNPVLRVGTQIAEAVRVHQPVDRRRAWTAMLDLLGRVGLAAENAVQYPHQLSGGMRQRALIAMALACQPAILIADEPTSALDPIAQAGILDLLRRLREEQGLSMLVATHDLGVAVRLCERIAVLYAGQIVEIGGTAELIARPRHPYTLGLLRSLPPRLGSSGEGALEPIPGCASPAWQHLDGCRFRNRCSWVQHDCGEREPELTGIDGRKVACFHSVGTP